MKILKIPGLLVFVALYVFLVVPGHSDVIITLGVNAFGGLHYWPTQVTFSEIYFYRFYKCLCDNRIVCKARYDSNKQVTDVWHGNHGIHGSGGPSYYYYCTYKTPKKIICERSIQGRYYQAFHVLGAECRHSCVGLYWFYSYEIIDFTKSWLSAQDCDGNCNCSEANTAATTRTSTSATTTCTTPPTTASATTTTTIPSSATINTTATPSTTESTPASTVSKSPKNDSGDDPQLGLIIGVVFVIIIVAIIIVIIGIFLWRRKQKQNALKPQNVTQNSTTLNNFNNVISTLNLQSRFTNTQNDYLYNVAPSHGNNLNNNCANGGNFVREAMSLSTGNSIKFKNIQTKPVQNDLENTKTHPERRTGDPAAVTPSYAHSSQTANQLSRHSIIQPISDRVSNENTDFGVETNNAAALQNHIYYILEGGKEDGEASDRKRNNIYFELEEQTDVSESDTEEA